MSDEQPFIAFLTKRFPRLSETFVLNEFLELRAQGLPIRLFAIMDPEEEHSHPEAEALRPQVTYLRGSSLLPSVPRVLRVASRYPRGTVSALSWVLRRPRVEHLRRLVEALLLVDALDGRRVHLHVHWAHGPAAVAFLAHRIAGIPWSLTTHAKDLYTIPAGDVAERCAQAAFVATCTAANVHHLVDVIGVDPGKVVLCRHGVRFDRFDASRHDPQPGRILSVGRLVAKKGLPVLIDACSLLRERNIEFHLDVVGDGPLAGELATRVAERGLQSRVTFHAGRPQPELVPFYQRAAVFALTPAVQANGDRDGIPNVILEAMASGTPVVVSAISGIPEVVIDDQTGLLVPPDDPPALAAAVARLLNDPSDAARLGKGGAVAVRAEFAMSTCVDPVANLLRARLDVVVERRLVAGS
jgi:glycosyltransferase involved in cell wall biosynthesis